MEAQRDLVVSTNEDINCNLKTDDNEQSQTQSDNEQFGKICKSMLSRHLCSSSKGQKSLFTVFTNMENDQYLNVEEAIKEALDVLDNYIRFFQDLFMNPNDPYDNKDLIGMAEILKKKFVELKDEFSTEESSRLKHYPLAVPEDTKGHKFDGGHMEHCYIAISEYYRKLLKPVPPRSGAARLIHNKPDSIESVEYIVNKKILKEYNRQIKLFKQEGKVNEDNTVRELLLFHGTDGTNVESIFENNFDIDRISSHKKKLMAYGRGIYLTEHPEIGFGHGDKIILCKVLPGKVEKISLQDKRHEPGQTGITPGYDSMQLDHYGVGIIHVIRDASQVLPYCVYNLTAANSHTPLHRAPLNPNNYMWPPGPPVRPLAPYPIPLGPVVPHSHPHPHQVWPSGPPSSSNQMPNMLWPQNSQPPANPVPTNPWGPQMAPIQNYLPPSQQMAPVNYLQNPVNSLQSTPVQVNSLQSTPVTPWSQTHSLQSNQVPVQMIPGNYPPSNSIPVHSIPGKPFTFAPQVSLAPSLPPPSHHGGAFTNVQTPPNLYDQVSWAQNNSLLHTQMNSGSFPPTHPSSQQPEL